MALPPLHHAASRRAESDWHQPTTRAVPPWLPLPAPAAGWRAGWRQLANPDGTWWLVELWDGVTLRAPCGRAPSQCAAANVVTLQLRQGKAAWPISRNGRRKVLIWRRGWDSNPRGAVRPHPISSRRRCDRFGTSPGGLICNELGRGAYCTPSRHLANPGQSFQAAIKARNSPVRRSSNAASPRVSTFSRSSGSVFEQRRLNRQSGNSRPTPSVSSRAGCWSA